MRVLLNLNETVRVRLTPAGDKIVRRWLKDFLPDGGTIVPRWAAEKYLGPTVEMQLHELMAVFGPHLHVGGENLFERNDLEVEFGS